MTTVNTHPIIRPVRTGLGDGMSLGYELVGTPAIFGFGGLLLDRRLGTTPLFMVLFSGFVFGYVCWKLWTNYAAEMTKLSAELAINRDTTAAGDIAAVEAGSSFIVHEPITTDLSLPSSLIDEIIADRAPGGVAGEVVINP